MNRGQTGNSDKVLLGSLLQQGRVRTNNRPPCLLAPWGGDEFSLMWGEGRGVPRSPLERWLRCFVHLLLGGVSRGMGHTLLLLRTLQKWQLDLLVSLYLLSRICSYCTCMQLFLVPYNCFLFCCLRRGVSSCKHCSTAAKDPRSHACLT